MTVFCHAFLRLLQIIKKIFVPVPGWNKNCKELHKKARRSFKIWRTAGKIRHGPLYENMKALENNLLQVLNTARKNVQKFKIQFKPLLLKIMTAHNFGRMSKKAIKNRCIPAKISC